MVLVWGYLAKGNDGHTLVMVAINSLTMLFLYGPLGGFLLGVGQLPVPWQALALSIAIYVALPLVAGYISRRLIIRAKGEEWFNQKFVHFLTPITIIALLITLVLLFTFKGEVILAQPLTILWIAIPLFIQTMLIFTIGYVLAKRIHLTYEDAAPSAMIGASNHFEVAIATATILFGTRFRSGSGNGGGGPDRSTGDAPAGENLSPNTGLVYMKRMLVIEWKHIGNTVTGTCERCSLTGGAIQNVLEDLTPYFKEKNVTARFRETVLPDSQIEQSNQVLSTVSPWRIICLEQK